jgi:hypothetical protein
MQIDLPGLKPSEAKELAELAAKGFKFNESEFGVTSYVDSAVYEKMNYTIFDRLNEQLKLEDFGTGIKHIVFAFIALGSTSTQEQGIQYYPNHKEISIGLALNYEQLLESTPEAAVNMMKELYLNGLRVLPLFNIKDFDVQGLIAAVEAALEESVPIC